MSQEEIITVVVNGLVFVLAAWLIVYLFILTLTRPRAEQPVPDDPDFEQFYLDLLGADLTVDYTRHEAQILYRICLELEKEKHYETLW